MKREFTFRLFAWEGIMVSGAYLVVSLLEYELLCNVLSALNAAISTAIFVYSYVKSGETKTTGRAIPFFALACFSWFTADLFWLIVFLQGLNPIKTIAITYLYSFTNIFLFLAVLTFSYYEFKKWGSVQLLLDSIVLVVVSIMLIWISFFHKEKAWIDLLMQDGFNSALCIILDFIIIVGTLITILSCYNKKVPAYLILYGAGILSFCFSDLYYYYIFSNDQYIPNSLLDVTYVVSLLLLALGGLRKSLFDFNSNIELKPGIGFRQAWLLLFLFPLAALISEGLVVMDLMQFLLAIFMYKISCDQVNLSIEKDKLYQKEKALNTTLEQRIEEQYGELIYLANHDTVTNLHNRRFFVKSIDKAIGDLSEDEILAVFLIDLDRFKTINDTLGHDVGDSVLIEISARIDSHSSGRALLARLGGDEFALFARGKLSRDDIAKLADDIIGACSLPLFIHNNELHMTMSLGIAIYPFDADSRITLMRNADIAMYRAKAQGYNKYVFYDPFFVESVEKKNEIEVLLRKVNIEKDFELYYQPQFNIATKKLIGAEALLRWKSTEHGLISPKEFIPIAEEIDCIIKIGRWVFNEAVRQIIRWNTTYSMNLKMGINISPKQIMEDELLSIIKKLMNNENFKSTWIDAEITENILLESNCKTNEVFKAFKDLNISVSVDDFGSGYSTFGYLSKFPFDRIKIDQTLIDQLSEDNSNAIQVIKALIGMADSMGIATIAEGVETQQQLDILHRLNCQQVQGFFLGRPVPAVEFEKLFIQND